MLLKTKNDWDDHIVKLEHVLLRLVESGLKVNVEKSFFGQYKCEYLGYWVTQDSIWSLKKKAESITNIQPPTMVWQVRIFVGIINYYRYMWPQCRQIFTPLTNITSENTKFKWGEVDIKALEEMNHIVGKHALLAHQKIFSEFLMRKESMFSNDVVNLL